MAFGIILYDLDRRIVAIDHQAAILFGLPPQDLVGRQITDFTPRSDSRHLDDARLTFERFGEASGHYALVRDDGSRLSIIYRVLANAPIPGVNLMAIAPSDADAGSNLAPIRRIGDDVFIGVDVSEDERWFGAGPLAVRRSMPSALIWSQGDVIAAVFPTEQDAWAALLSAQPRVEAPIQIALSSFDGGWPRDHRSVLVVRGAHRDFETIAAVVAEFGGTLMSCEVPRVLPHTQGT